MFFDAFITPRLPSSFRFELEDATPVLLRPLAPADAGRLREGFTRLSQMARRRRFFTDFNELDEARLRALTELDQRRNAAWGCIDLNRPEEPGVGVGRYSTVNGDAGAADVAITVLDAYRGRGAGLLLHACLHLHAHRHGIRRFYYDVLADDERLIRRLKALGARFEGRATNIDRLSMPVYHRAWDVPCDTREGRRLAALMQRLRDAEPGSA